MRTKSASIVAAGALVLALCGCGSSGDQDVSAVAAGTVPSVSTSLTAPATSAGDASKTAELLDAAVSGDPVKVKQLLADDAKPDIGVAQTLVYADADDPSLITAMIAA